MEIQINSSYMQWTSRWGLIRRPALPATHTRLYGADSRGFVKEKRR